MNLVDQLNKITDSLLKDIFRDESRMLTFIDVIGTDRDAQVAQLTTSIRYLFFSKVKEELNIGSLNDEVMSAADRIESLSLKKIKWLISEYLDPRGMSDMMRPGRI